jgi:hypothetical protein
MEVTIGPGSRVVSYARRDIREDVGASPSYGAVVNPAEGESLVAFDDGEIERVENATLLPAGGCPLCEKLNIEEAKFCGGCGVQLGEQALLQFEANTPPPRHPKANNTPNIHHQPAANSGKRLPPKAPPPGASSPTGPKHESMPDFIKKKIDAKKDKKDKKKDEAMMIPEEIGTTPSGKLIRPYEHKMYASNEAFFEATKDWTPADHKAAAYAHFHQGIGCNELAGSAHEMRVAEMGGMMAAPDPIREVGG